MKKLRIVSLLLAVLFVCGMLTACSDQPNPETTTGAEGVVTTPAADVTTQDPTLDENGYKLDDLPEDLKFNEELQVLTWSNVQTWDWNEDGVTTGDNIKDAILQRQTMAEERLGVTIKVTGVAGDWDNRSTFVQTLANDIGSGDAQFDLVCQYTPAGAIATVRGLYYALNDVKYLNLSQPWWAQDIAEASTINGKVFTVAGDISCTLIRTMTCILTNLDMAEDNNAENFYQLVRDHKWTTAKFMEYGTGTNAGLSVDGTQQFTTGMSSNVCLDHVFYGGGMRFLVKDADKGLVLSEDLSNGKLEDFYGLWRRFLSDNDDVNIGNSISADFAPGNELFYFGSISDVQNTLQDIDFKFGILPFPLYDENQKDYCTVCGYWVSIFGIPTGCSDKDCSAAMLEALGSASYRTLTPAVYTVSFTYRFLNSLENAEMFDILHNTLVFEPGRQLGDQVNCFSAFRKTDPSTSYDTWTSVFKENSKVWENNIKKVIRAIEE